MPTEAFADQPQTTVSSGGTTAPVSGTVETWTVASSATFPVISSGVTQFHVRDPNATSEMILVTAVAGVSWTVTRGVDGTTPVAHPTGFTVVQVVPASVLGTFLQQTGTVAQNNVLAGPATGGAGLAAFRALQQPDIPALSAYAPIGLTGAQAVTSYAGGVPLPGHPLFGTWSQGQWVLDPYGQMYVCVTSGTPGSWRRVGRDPWQFFLADYAKCDGQQALVNTVNASATINATPVAAPAAPTLSTATTGGTIAAGTYTVAQTYVNRYGETVASATGTQTTTGSTSTITVTQPAAQASSGPGNITGYYVYFSQVGQSTPLTRQQPAGTPTPLTTPFILTAPPTSSGANPPGSNTTATPIFAFTTTPAVPASGTPVTNTNAFSVGVVVTGGTVTNVVVSGYGSVGTGPGTYTVPPGSTITLTYSAAPTWSWPSPDVSKNVMICGAAGIPGGPAIDTINTVVSTTQATITTAGNITTTLTGAPMFFASDDRLNVDAWSQDMQAYLSSPSSVLSPVGALTGRGLVQGIVPDRYIGLGTGLFQSVYGGLIGNAGEAFNTQVRLPYGNISGQDIKAEVDVLGPGDNAHNYFWVSQLPNLVGGSFVSFSSGPNTADPTYGQQSIMASPAGSFGAGSNAFSNTKYVVKGVQFVQPGWSNSIGLDLQDAGGCRVNISSQVYAPTTNTGGGINPSNAWVTVAFWQNNKISAGIRLPNSSNNDDVLVESLAIEGINFPVLTQADHVIFTRLSTINTYWAVYLTGGGTNTHDLDIFAWSYENVAGAGLANNNSFAGHIKVFAIMDGENGPGIPAFDIKDPGGQGLFYGQVYWSDPFRGNGPNGWPVPVISGCTNLSIFNGQLAKQVYGAPAYTLGTAFQNPWVHPMTITLAGGTVTGISIGQHGAALTNLGFTSGTFRLPSTWDINIAGSVKPTTFIAVPD